MPIISAKVKDDGGVLVDSSGLHLDLNWINSHITAPTPDVNQGYGITVTGGTGAVTVSAKPKENGGVTVDTDGISITIKPSGGILVDGTGIYVDEEWLEEQVPAPKAGNGISISGSTVSVKPNENGGIIVDNLGVSVNVTEGGGLVVDGTGVHIDESWLADNTFNPVEGNGITISGSTISAKPKEGGGIIVDGTGISVDTSWLSSQIPVYEEGDGITIAGTTVSVKPNMDAGIVVDSSGIAINVKDSGGLAVDSTGVYIDESWLSGKIPKYTEGDGIDISGTTVAVDNTVVRTTGNQTIAGDKTFSQVVNGATPAAGAAGTELVTAEWIRTNLASLIQNILSADEGNALTVEDGKLKVIVVSKDAGNLLVSGSDKGAYTPYDYGTLD